MPEARSYQAKEASEALHAGRVVLPVGERGGDLAFDHALNLVEHSFGRIPFGCLST